jgi:hypothetical protein
MVSIRMEILIKSKIIKAKWLIEGQPDFFIGEDKKLYRVKTQREIKLTLNGYTKGYYLNRKFFSLIQLRPLVRKLDV